MRSVNKLRKYIFLCLMTAAAMVLGIIEGMIPFPFVAPGAKLGLTNIITLSVLAVLGIKSALLVVTLRCLLMMLVAGNPISFVYSLAAGLSSAMVMYIALKIVGRHLSLTGISVLGAMAHNTAQISVAAVMFSSSGIFMYLPLMSIVSIFTGCFVGYAAVFVTENLNKSTFIQGEH